jgi:exosome complex RNA-binding protein Rrp4
MATLPNKIRKYVNAEVDFTSDVILQDDMVGGVSNPYIKEWNLDIAKPTDAQLDALETQAQTYENNQQIIATRKSLYGSWESQLEEIYDDGIDSWKARILQIKTDNPKETE